MGKLHVESTDLGALEKLTSGKVTVKDGQIQVDMGGAAIVLDGLQTSGHFDQNGVRFDVGIRIADGNLEVDFQ